MEKIRVLITGAYGYIGHNLQPFLREKGYEVVCVDRKLGNEVLDITEETLIELGIDHVVHLAAISGLANCAENLQQAYIDNIKSVTHLFNEMGKAKVNGTFASSQAAKTPTANYYGLTKYFGELEAEIVRRKYSINLNVLRFTNIYGGLLFLETKNTVVSRFANSKKQGLPLTINGAGNQERDFIHVNDVCEAIWRSILFGCEWNVDIGTGVATTIRQLAEHFNHRFTNNMTSDTIGTIRNVADPKHAYHYLGFKSKIELKEQIRKEFF